VKKTTIMRASCQKQDRHHEQLNIQGIRYTFVAQLAVVDRVFNH